MRQPAGQLWVHPKTQLALIGQSWVQSSFLVMFRVNRVFAEIISGVSWVETQTKAPVAGPAAAQKSPLLQPWFLEPDVSLLGLGLMG